MLASTINPPSLLISGAGDLGLRIAKKISLTRPPSTICCETRTPSRHPLLQSFGFSCRLESDAHELSFDQVVLCFPPSPTYDQEIARAISQWNHKGSALMISSTGVYHEDNGGWVDEHSPTLSSPLSQAEDRARERDLHILRLAGLYDLNTGPHRYWERQIELPSSPHGLINLIHRDDAADAACCILNSPQPPQTWVLADGQPLTRNEISQAWAQFQQKQPCQFTQPGDKQSGKKVRPTKFFHDFNWSPNYSSFLDFLRRT
jgi:nucleoside-diphosphate-sugar epimerase